MPVYEYRCLTCKHVQEVTKSIHDDTVPLCDNKVDGEPCCGNMEKIISRNSFQLKGGGWYKDGY